MQIENVSPWWLRRLVLPAAILIVGLWGAHWFSLHYKVIISASTDRCIPGWVFVVEKGVQPRRGDLAMVLSHKAEYLSAGIRIVKVVAGVGGDTVDVSLLYVSNGHHTYYAPIDAAAAYLKLDPLTLTGKRLLEEDEIFMIGTVNGSYDSRFFGPMKRRQVVGRAYLII